MKSADHNRFARLSRPGRVEFCEEALAPSLPRPDYVRLKVDFCAVCGGDIALYKGWRGAAYPRTIGHEYFGEIILMGGEVNGFEVGSQVAVDPNYRCGTCRFCQAGKSHLCEFSALNLFHPRGFSRYVDIHHSYLHEMPASPAEYSGALIEPLSCALHAIEQAQIHEKDRVLISGCGGQGTLLVLAIFTFYPHLRIEVFDPNSKRAANLVATWPDQVVTLPAPQASRRYSLVFETSGQPEGFNAAVAAVQSGGRIVVISRYRGRSISIPNDIAQRGVSLTFSHLNGDGQPFLQAMRLLSTRWEERFERLFAVKPFSQLNEVFPRVERSPHAKTIIRADG